MQGLPVEELVKVGYIVAFKGKYAYLYHAAGKMCVRVEAKIAADLKAVTQYQPCSLPEGGYIELWNNGMRIARNSVKMIETDYEDLDKWKKEKETAYGAELKFSLDLSDTKDVAGEPFVKIAINGK